MPDLALLIKAADLFPMIPFCCNVLWEDEMTDLLFFNLHFFLVQISVKTQVVLTNFGCCHGDENLHINISLTFT